MTPAHSLSDELEALREQWERQQAPIARILAPGLSAGDITRRWEEAGVTTLPAEAVALWSWRNGTTVGGGPGQSMDTCIGPGSWSFLSVEQAISLYTRMRETSSEPLDSTHPVLARAYWHEQWVPVFKLVLQTYEVYLDGDQEPSPVFVRDRYWEVFDTPQADSLTAAVVAWTDLLRREVYRWDGSSWQFDASKRRGDENPQLT